jgi:outer membrane cobalamin receptor
MQRSVLAVAVALATSAHCAAQDQIAALDEVVVTASRFKDRFDDKPVNMTVITGEDIRRSAAKTVPDLLSEQAGIQIHDFFGNNATTTTVDLRGFGVYGTQNTLILVMEDALPTMICRVCSGRHFRWPMSSVSRSCAAAARYCMETAQSAA